jgi:hypothetical protein
MKIFYFIYAEAGWRTDNDWPNEYRENKETGTIILYFRKRIDSLHGVEFAGKATIEFLPTAEQKVIIDSLTFKDEIIIETLEILNDEQHSSFMSKWMFRVLIKETDQVIFEDEFVKAIIGNKIRFVEKKAH